MSKNSATVDFSSIKNIETNLFTINSYAQKMLDKVKAPGVSNEELWFNIAKCYSDDESHAKRMYDYFLRKLFLPSTPIIANTPFPGKPYRGKPISCFLSQANNDNITKILEETAFFSKNGGGLGTLWSEVSPIGHTDKSGLNQEGVISGIKIQGQIMRYFSGFARESGSMVSFLDISHPDIEEFIDMRKNSAGLDPGRLVPRYIHHGVVISDEFMAAALADKDWALHYEGKVFKTVKARDLYLKIILTRLETGEPFIFYSGNVNKDLALHHKLDNMSIKTTNLCTEITLLTGTDYDGIERTAVCCLGSINFAKYYEWNENLEQFIEDISRFQDNVLTMFISAELNVGDIWHENNKFGQCAKFRALEKEVVNRKMDSKDVSFKSVRSAYLSRDIGIGILGFSTFLQNSMIPMDSEMARDLNKKIFSDIKKSFDRANELLAEERGSCPDAARHGIKKRFSYMQAVAPTSVISHIAGVSPSIEIQYPIFTLKNNSVFTMIRNPSLEKRLNELGMNREEIWNKIAMNMTVKGVLSNEDYEVFKGPTEVSHNKIIDMIAERGIDQSQSFNMFYNAPINVQQVVEEHLHAYKRGVKTLYYVHSSAVLQVSKNFEVQTKTPQKSPDCGGNNYECIACQ